MVFCAQHILVSDNGRANKIKALIETGQISFADAAKEYSTCPSSAKGGDLGTFAEGAMVGAFNDYCFDVRRSHARLRAAPWPLCHHALLRSRLIISPLQPDTPLNELGVVRTTFGAHIIKLTKKP